MLTEDSRLELESQIRAWLSTGPADAEVIEYWEKLSDDDALKAVLNEAADFISVLSERKAKYFVAAGCEAFLKTVAEPEQLIFLDNCTRYNPPSVLRKLSETYPAVATVALPADLSTWARAYLAQFNAVIAVATANDFIQAKLFLGSLMRSVTGAELPAINEKLNQLFLQETQALEVNRTLEQGEIDTWAAFFRSLKFLPEQQCIEYSQPDAYLSRQQLFFTLSDALTVLINAPIEANKEEVLWDLQRSKIVRNAMAIQEGQRQIKYFTSPATEEAFQSLYTIWTEENIALGTAAGQTAQVLRQAQEMGQTIDIKKFLSDNFIIEALCEPIYPGVIIKGITDAPSPAEAEVYLSQMLSSEEFAPKKELLEKLFHQLVAVIRPL